MMLRVNKRGRLVVFKNSFSTFAPETNPLFLYYKKYKKYESAVYFSKIIQNQKS